MHVVQYDHQFRVDWPENASGYYYWTNTWYYDLDNPGGPTSSQFQVRIAQAYGRLPFVKTSAYRVTDPPHSGIVTSGGPLLKTGGSAPFTDECPIWNIARLNFFSAGVYVGYKLWRMPIPPDEQADGLLSPAVHGYLQSSMTAPLYLAKICSADGLPIDNIVVSPRLHQWGLRHGTKRRDRPVLPWS